MRRAVLTLAVTVLVAAVMWWVAGDGIRMPLIRRPSPHEQYARALERANLQESVIGQAWLSAAASAPQRARAVTLPFSASGSFDPPAPAALAWRFQAERGRRIDVQVELDPGAGEVFVDLFRLKAADTLPSGDGSHEAEPILRRQRKSEKADGATASKDGKAGSHEIDVEHVVSAEKGARTLQHEPSDDGVFILRVQPELLVGGGYVVRQRAVATLAFPVEGVAARAVQSTFGDPRDRGARLHQGIDIFAPRGTPALAATDGWVTAVTTNRLGGTVVWVWDMRRSQALYYAHLDRANVSSGQRVKVGDVIGYVGNSGNARTTPPHLHFGIYRPIEGGVDPLPFVCDAPCGSSGMAYAR